MARCVLKVVATVRALTGVVGAPVTSPTEATAVNDLVGLNLGACMLFDPVSGGSFQTRCFNGGLPGPTLRVRPGETLRVQFSNNLGMLNPICSQTGTQFCEVNTTNLHAHGLHVSPNSELDNSLRPLPPNSTGQWFFDIPHDHMGGTHWYHPDFHHSASIQVGGGAAGLLIVEDPPGSLPAEILNMEERIIFIHCLNLQVLQGLARMAQDQMLQISSGDLLTMVNGQMSQASPTVTLTAGTWYRFRILLVSLGELLRLQPVSTDGGACEMQLLAKDGVYLEVTPRAVAQLEMGPGNRADVAVRCTCSGAGGCSANFQSLSTGNDGVFSGSVFHVAIGASRRLQGMANNDLLRFRPLRPCYLADLRQAAPVHSHNVTLSRSAGGYQLLYDGVAEVFSEAATVPPAVGTIVVGSVQHWHVTGLREFPLHLHTFPFQIIDGMETGYTRAGDWGDTLRSDSNEATLRFVVDRFTGLLVANCQGVHADEGAVAYINVSGIEGARAYLGENPNCFEREIGDSPPFELVQVPTAAPMETTAAPAPAPVTQPPSDSDSGFPWFWVLLVLAALLAAAAAILHHLEIDPRDFLNRRSRPHRSRGLQRDDGEHSRDNTPRPSSSAGSIASQSGEPRYLPLPTPPEARKPAPVQMTSLSSSGFAGQTSSAASPQASSSPPRKPAPTQMTSFSALGGAQGRAPSHAALRDVAGPFAQGQVSFRQAQLPQRGPQTFITAHPGGFGSI